MRNKCKCGKEKISNSKQCKSCHMIYMASLKLGKRSPIKGTHRVTTLHICEQCSKEFYPHDRSKKNRFCSFGCYCQWRKEIARRINNPRSTVAYAHWRDKVLEKAQGKCEVCGSKRKLVAHHIVNIREKPELIYNVSNGQILCYICHSKVHKFITHLQ